MDGCRASGVRRGIQAQGEVLIMGRIKGVQAFSSEAEWGSVSRLSHTLACSMLLELNKLPHNYPGGTPKQERLARGGESERGKGRSSCRADRHHEASGPGPDVGLQVARTQMMAAS